MKKRTLVCFLIFTLCVLYTSIPNTVFGQEASLAQQVFDKHGETLQREDIQAVLPQVLEGLKAPNIQALLNPQTIGLVVANPDLLPQFAPDIDPQFVTLLKEDAELQALLNDPQVQELLQDPAAIDELAGLLNVGAPVSHRQMTQLCHHQITQLCRLWMIQPCHHQMTQLCHPRMIRPCHHQMTQLCHPRMIQPCHHQMTQLCHPRMIRPCHHQMTQLCHPRMIQPCLPPAEELPPGRSICTNNA